jgi:hypothetical protein
MELELEALELMADEQPLSGLDCLDSAHQPACLSLWSFTRR